MDRKARTSNAALHLSREKQRLLEQELSRLNSQLATSVEALGGEIERMKQLSDEISTLYEELGRFTGTGG